MVDDADSNAFTRRYYGGMVDSATLSGEEGGLLSPEHVLRTLAQEGILSIIVEGGQKVLQSFYDADLIDEIHMYTVPHELKDAKLKNPELSSSIFELFL